MGTEPRRNSKNDTTFSCEENTCRTGRFRSQFCCLSLSLKLKQPENLHNSTTKPDLNNSALSESSCLSNRLRGKLWWMTLRSNVAASMGHKTSKSGRKLLCELVKLLAIKSTLTVDRNSICHFSVSTTKNADLGPNELSDWELELRVCSFLARIKNGATEMILILKRLVER